VDKKGGFQAEIRYSLDCARQIPLDEIFIVSVGLTACPVPRSIPRELQYVDLFPDWIDGPARLVTMLQHEVALRAALRHECGAFPKLGERTRRTGQQASWRGQLISATPRLFGARPARVPGLQTIFARLLNLIKLALHFWDAVANLAL
jgi:hypothetical protein